MSDINQAINKQADPLWSALTRVVADYIRGVAPDKRESVMSSHLHALKNKSGSEFRAEFVRRVVINTSISLNDAAAIDAAGEDLADRALLVLASRGGAR